MKHFELQIQNLLLKNDPLDVIRTVLSEIKYDDNLSFKNLNQRLLFLFNVKEFQSLFKITQGEILNKSNDTAFLLWLKIHHELGHSAPLKQLQPLIDTQNLKIFRLLAIYPTLFGSNEFLNQEHKKLRQLLLKRAFEHKKSLIEKIEFMRSQRILDGIKESLDEFLKAHPDDAKYKTIQSNLSERWARNIIEKHSRKKGGRKTKTPPDSIPLPPYLFKEMKKFAQSSFQNCYNLVIFCLFTHSFDQALTLCQYLDSEKKEHLWIHLETCISSKKYFFALDLLSQIETKLSADPDTAIAVMYYKALIMKGLQHRVSAVDLIQQVITFKPNYRSASSLLRSWKEELDE